MGKSYRSGRINEEIRRKISDMVMNDLKDPRIPLLTSITAVEVTKDLSYANIYVSVMGTEEEKKATMDALQKAAGHVRREVGKSVKLRCTPEMIFKLDQSIEYGFHISKIIADTKKDDKESCDKDVEE